MKKVLVSLLIGCVVLGVGCGNTVSQEDYNKVIEEKETLVKNNKDLVKDKQELQAKIDSAKDYFELDENEKVLVDQKIEEVNKATEEQKEAEIKAKEEEEAKKKAEEEATKLAEEAQSNSHIGETMTFTTSDYSGVVGTFTLTINNVYKTDERNMFEDPINQVVVIEYTVENISIPNDDFYCALDIEGAFYNSDGYKVGAYPGGRESVSDLAKGMKANGKAYIGINNDTPYLEMHYGGMTYKWTF